MRNVTFSLILCCLVVAWSTSDADGQPTGMVFIPDGSFQMGDTFSDGSSDEQPVHTVYLTSCHFDTYEVTNAQYAEALNWAKSQGNLITVTSAVVLGLGWSFASTPARNPRP